MLVVEPDLRTVIQLEPVGQNDVVRAKSRIVESIGRVNMLKYSEESRRAYGRFLSSFCPQNSAKSRSDRLIFSNYSAWYEKNAFGRLILSEAHQYMLDSIGDYEVDRN